jgi:hypothetical protein
MGGMWYKGDRLKRLVRRAVPAGHDEAVKWERA